MGQEAGKETFQVGGKEYTDAQGWRGEDGQKGALEQRRLPQTSC